MWGRRFRLPISVRQAKPPAPPTASVFQGACATALILFFCLPLICSAVIIDRIAVTVGNQVITESELVSEIRLTAFLNDEPVVIDRGTKRAAASRLIEQKLIRKELTWSRYPVPNMAETAPMLQRLLNNRFHNNEAELKSALAKHGLTEEDLNEHLLWRLTLLRFIDFRFRPGILVSEQEIEEYYKTQILPLAKAANPGKEPTLEEYRARIERVLTGERETQELNAWLTEARSRTRIEFREDAFE